MHCIAFDFLRVFFKGFLEKEIKKDGIPMLDTGDNPDAPVPREMIDLEVRTPFFSLLKD